MSNKMFVPTLFFGIATMFLAWSLVTSPVHAWFGAGRIPGWAPTTTGLSGEIPLPSYKFAPDFYTIGQVVSPSVTGFNPGTAPVTSHYYFAVSRVIESPLGTNITDGTPSTPGINENDLNSHHQANNDIQSQVALLDLGTTTFPASGSAVMQAHYTTTATGYYQFDFIDIDPATYAPGHILAAGFFRVLPGASASPSPSPSPSPTPTPTPTQNNNNGGGSGDGRSDGRSSCPECTKTPESNGQVLSASTGEVLGAYAHTGVVEDAIMNGLGVLGGVMTTAGSVLYGKKRARKSVK